MVGEEAMNFLEVSVQDTSGAPLENRVELCLHIVKLMEVATGKDGGQVWCKFKKDALAAIEKAMKGSSLVDTRVD
jgi:hypothetical protein